MDKDLKECLPRMNSAVLSAIQDGRLSGQPFAEFTSHAAAVFCGFETLIEIIQTSQMLEVSGDEGEAARALNQCEMGAPLSMMRSVSSVMDKRVGDLADWAEERITERGAYA